MNLFEDVMETFDLYSAAHQKNAPTSSVELERIIAMNAYLLHDYLTFKDLLACREPFVPCFGDWRPLRPNWVQIS